MNETVTNLEIPHMENTDAVSCPKCGSLATWEIPGDGMSCHDCSHAWDSELTLPFFHPEKEFTSIPLTDDVEIGFRMSDVTDWKCYTHEGVRTLFLSLTGRKEALRLQGPAAIKIHELIKDRSAEVKL